MKNLIFAIAFAMIFTFSLDTTANDGQLKKEKFWKEQEEKSWKKPQISNSKKVAQKAKPKKRAKKVKSRKKAKKKSIPIDGGLSIFLLAAGAVGVSALRKRK